MGMTFAGVATSAFFRLDRLHRPVVVTKDGVDMVDGCPVAIAAVWLDAADAMPGHFVGGVRVIYADDLLENAINRVVRCRARRHCSCRAGSPTIR
jgi:hypothetical protein